MLKMAGKMFVVLLLAIVATCAKSELILAVENGVNTCAENEIYDSAVNACVMNIKNDETPDKNNPNSNDSAVAAAPDANNGCCWTASFGPRQHNSLLSVIPAKDEGFIVVGSTSYSNVFSDALIVKLSAGGEVLWNQIYGDKGLDLATTIEYADGNNYFVGGTWHSNSLWVFKIDVLGNKIWNTALNDAGHGEVFKLFPGNDGSLRAYGVVRNMESDSFQIPFRARMCYFDSDGKLLKDDQRYQNPDSRMLYEDGSYLYTFLDLTRSKYEKNYVNSGKVGANGKNARNRVFKGNNRDEYHPAKQVEFPDASYMVVGDYFSKKKNRSDIWAVSYDAKGAELWVKSYDTSRNEVVSDAFAVSDGGIVLFGVVADIYENHDGFVAKISKNGDLLWYRTYGKEGDDHFQSMRILSDESIIIVGASTSFKPLDWAAWVLRLNPDGECPGCN